MKSIFLLLLCICYFVITTHAQYIPIKQETTFSSRIDNPIEVKAELQDTRIHLFAENRSTYAYVVELEFVDLKNLVPYTTSYSDVIGYGKHRLITFEIKDLTQAIDYSYRVKYYMGSIANDIKRDHPYLIPLAPQKKVKLYYPEQRPNTYNVNYFAVNPGDTIYCMRKGYVTAEPVMHHQNDRISSRKSLEIRHPDGSVMTYENLCPESIFNGICHEVFPGQALGVANEKGYIEVWLYEFLDEGHLRSSPILYTYDQNRVKPFDLTLDSIKVVHPPHIITKEMTKREKRRFKQNKLY